AAPAAVAAVPAAPAAASAVPAAERPQKVVIVSLPGVTWRDVARGTAPTLKSLAETWSMASLSVRVVDSPTDPASAFATIGAGNRARGLGPGDDSYTPNAGPLPGGGLQVAEWRQVVNDNAHLHFGAVPGSLGDALHAAGLKTGVVGNEDEINGGLRVPQSYAALALADSAGRVDAGNVGEALSPGTGLATVEDPSAIAAAAAAALSTASVVLVDLDEARRAGDDLSSAETRLRNQPSAAVLDSPVRTAAIARDDRALAATLQSVDLRHDTVIVLGTVGPGASWPDTLTVAVEAGVGVARDGWLTSATTQRDGLITLPDVAPQILSLLGRPIPRSMTGQAIQSVPASSNRLAALVGLDQAANSYRDRIASLLLVLGVVAVASFVAGWVRLARGYTPGKVLLTAAGLALGAAPVAALVQAAVGAERWSVVPAFVLLAAVDGAIVAVAMAGPWRRWPMGPPGFVVAVTVAVIAGDLLSGSHGQLVSLIGYSPIEAGRFYGLSPLSFAVLSTDVLAFGAVLAAVAGRRAAWAAAGIGALTVVVAGAPMFGAKFGAILTLVPAFGLLVVALSARRVSAGKVLLLLVAAGAVALAAGVADALRPSQQQTHIGRFIAGLFGGGPGSVSDVIIRKLDANLGIYGRVPFAMLIPVVLAFLAFALWRPPPWLRSRIAAVPGLGAGLWAALAANVIGAAVNDSGAGIPAMGLVIGVPMVMVVLMRVNPAPDPGSAPGESSP
ncbi:MAG TPA: hypothetical protein VHA57_11480, partial [Actinomycetota bacterium]|nr:hypothetical protein [Actinomycetota bacterium]